MYPGVHAAAKPDHPAFIMATSGITVSYGELDARSNRLAHLLRSLGLGRLAHYSIFMENNDRYVEACAAGERSGHYYTCVNSFLKADELAYILTNSESQVLITSEKNRAVAMAALPMAPSVRLCLVVDGPGDGDKVRTSTRRRPDCPRRRSPTNASAPPCSIRPARRAGPRASCARCPRAHQMRGCRSGTSCSELWQYREDMIYLSPAPLYHAAPQAAVALTIRAGGTAVIMERFDPEQYLALIEKHRITHSQLVPTMFSRMLKLPQEARDRHDLSSLEIAIHAAAPCPVKVKEDMIAWWGPIIHEYYGATEGLGFSACNSEEWLTHRGTVGRILLGELHVLDEDMNPLPMGTPGTLWFKTATEFEYFNDPDRTAQAKSPDGTMSTVGDVGYVDEDGFLYLTDRGVVHDHLGRRERLSPGVRGSADHPPQGHGCRRLRRPEPGPRRGGQGVRPAHARRARGTGHGSRPDRVLPGAPRQW